MLYQDIDGSFVSWKRLKPGTLFTTVEPITVIWPPENLTSRDEFGFPINRYGIISPTDLCFAITCKYQKLPCFDECFERIEVTLLLQHQLWWTRLETSEVISLPFCCI